MSRGLHKIGLTGGIGTGKSTVSARLTQLGACVLDADAISRALLEPDGACFDAVLDAFGLGILMDDGRLDRKMIATIIFMEPRMRKALNDIVHPAVRARMDDECERVLSENPSAIVIYDVPLLFECGWDRDMDQNILVVSDRAIVLERVSARDGAAIKDIEARMDAQMPEEKKRRYADYILENNGTLEALYEQVDALYRKILGANL